MRELTATEMDFVSGAGEDCPEDSGESGNNIVGVTDSDSFGDDLVNIYEGLVQATSHIIERVANAIRG
jgi:hypothetical protein